MQALTQRNDTKLFPGLLPCLDARDHFGTWPTTCFLFLLQAENHDRQSGFRGTSQGVAVDYVRYSTQIQRWSLEDPSRVMKGQERHLALEGLERTALRPAMIGQELSYSRRLHGSIRGR
jgi:hypothetical protein